MRTFTHVAAALGALSVTIGCHDTTTTDPIEDGWEVERGDEDAPSAPSSWCAPSPVAYDRDLVPALPVGVRYEGFCGHDAPALEADPTHTLRLDRDARVLSVDEGDPSTGASSQTTFGFDAQGRVVEVTRVGSQGFYGVGEGTSTYALNARGEVVHKTASQPFEGTTLVKVQEWDGPRLLSRTEREGSDDGRVVRRWRWTWEGERMVRGELVEDPDGDAPRTHSAAWTYDDAGRPASVERAVDGVALERASWTFREDDTLARRALWSRSPESVAAERGGDAARWALTRGLDDHQSEDAAGAQPDPWRAATSHLVDQGEGACRRVPRGVHGYPDHEPEYHLALSVAERPGRAGFAYGSNTFMWSYGNDSWFGHDGVASDWLGQSMGRGHVEELEVTLDYSAAGVMTREVATLTHGGRTLELERDRALDAAGGVLEDTATVSSEGVTHTRTLRFERDANGAILARDLLDGEGARIARQTWERDDRGRATRHVIESVDFAPPPAWMPEFHAPRTRTPSESYVWFWRHEGEHVVERGVEGGDTQRLTYDDEGRLTSRVGEYEQHSRSLWLARDDEGRLVEECRGSHDARYTSCVATTYDAAGRVAHRVQTTTTDGAPGEPVVIEYNLHVCE